MNLALIDILVHISLWTYVRISLGHLPRRGVSGAEQILYLVGLTVIRFLPRMAASISEECPGTVGLETLTILRFFLRTQNYEFKIRSKSEYLLRRS